MPPRGEDLHARIRAKSLWIVPEAYHTAALGYQPNEFKRRVLNFFADPARKHASSVISRGISESFENLPRYEVTQTGMSLFLPREGACLIRTTFRRKYRS